MQIDYSSILQTILLAIIAAVVPSIIAWLKAQAAYLVEKIRAAQPELTDYLRDAADIAVRAAEQSKLAGLIEDKKDYALEVAEAWLEARGVTIDLHLLEAAIEAAVGENFPHEEPCPPVGFEK